MFGSVDIKTRPIRFLFFVKPNDKASLKEAIRINSSIWGGVYNPIIPLYSKTPNIWKDKGLKTNKIQFYIEGYLGTFDPDIVVNMTGKDLPKYISERCISIIKPNEIWGKVKDKKEFNFAPKFGVGIFELYKAIFEKHFQYKEKYPHKVVLPKLPNSNNLFWLSFFGELPKDIFDIIKKESDYFDALDVEEYKITDGFNYLFRSENITPFRVVRHNLDTFGVRGFKQNECVFFMDANSFTDVIDYWNLRALGRVVLPLPIQYKNDKVFKEKVVNFLTEHRGPLRHNEKIWYCASFIKSRSTKIEEMQEYAHKLNFKDLGDKNNDRPYFFVKHWYPRIWDEWAREYDGTTPVDYFASKEWVDFETNNGEINISPLLPNFIFKHIFREFICANVINTKIYSGDELFAQAYPLNAGQNVIRNISSIGSWGNEYRISNRGIVKLIKYNYSIKWKLPKAQDLFFSWLKDSGWDAAQSTPGKVTQKIFKQIDGCIYFLRSKEIIDFFELMNKEDKENKYKNKGMQVGEVGKRLKKIDNSDVILKRFKEKKVFKLGITIKCPECSKDSWYELNDIQEIIKCSKCLEEFSSIGNIEHGQWTYKTTGPFSIPNYADGGYSVLLFLNLIMHDIKSRSLLTTPVFSFTASNNEAKIEADFAMLFKDQNFRGEINGVLFGECKTFGSFKKVDIDRMEVIAKSFPGSVLAFCKLDDKLSEKEKKLLTKIAKRGRKYYKNDLPINPVLILTGKELFSQWGPPTCWKDIESDVNKYDFDSLIELCNQTQRIHLDLPNWEEDWIKEFEKKRGKRKANTTKKKV